MNIPGFTAEASLYQTSEHYHAALEGTRAGGSVYPAQFAVPFKLTPEMFRPPCWTLVCEPSMQVYPGVYSPEKCRWLNIC
jgi:hypothetical protein